ncbi:MAG: HAD-IA family hydrolase [Candidatus Nanoarchaeia archaeon]
MVIKAIIFDWRGVMTEQGKMDNLRKTLAPKFNTTPEKLRPIIKTSWMPARIGKLSPKEFWKNIADPLKMDPKDIKKEFLDYVSIRKEVRDLAKKLKKKYKIALLSNHVEGWLEDELDNFKIRKLFDTITTSYKSKSAKPDSKIYIDAVKSLKLIPRECIYIDDLEENIHPANKIGMKGILFRNTNNLITDLEKLGVKT